MAWQWTARSNQPSRRIGGSRQPGSIGYPVRPLGDDVGCARRVPAIRSGVCAEHAAARFGHAVASDRSGCAGRIVKSGGLIRDIHAALSQLPSSPIIHIMSSNPDSGLPTGAGWILIGSRCGPACARSTGPHTRSDDPAGILASRVHNCAGGTSTCARRPTHRGSVPLTGGPDAGRPPTLMARYRARPSRRRRPDACALRRHPARTRPRTSTTSRTQSAQRTRTGRCTVS